MLTVLVAGGLLLGSVDPVRAGVPGSYVQVSFALEGFERGEEGMRRLAEAVGPAKAVLAGGVATKGVQVSVIAEVDDPHRSSADWRAEFKGASEAEAEAKFFEIDGVACSEQRVEVSPLLMASWNAYPVSLGVCFDLHVSWTGPAEKPSLTREDFAALVRSFRVGFVRRGSWEDLPPEVSEFFHRAGMQTPGEIAWIESECKSRPDDWVAHFALGELAFVRNASGKAPKAYARAVELLKKKKGATGQETFAWVLAEEGWGVDLGRAGKVAEALPHLKAGYDLAGDRKNLRAALAFNLACAYGLKADAPNAVKFLKEAASLEPRYGKQARKEESFEKVRNQKAFQDLLATFPSAEGK